MGGESGSDYLKEPGCARATFTPTASTPSSSRVKILIIHICVFSHMGHRTLTISDEAYNALSKMKKERESFTETILRITNKTYKGTLLNYIKTLEPDEEFASTLETILEDRNKITSRPIEN